MASDPDDIRPASRGFVERRLEGLAGALGAEIGKVQREERDRIEEMVRRLERRIVELEEAATRP